jgi:Na+/proline symporter
VSLEKGPRAGYAVVETPPSKQTHTPHRGRGALVNLLLIGYDGVSQLFPGTILGLFWKRVRAEAVLAGLLAGIAVASALVFTGHDPLGGINAGFLALALNAVLAVGLSLALGPKHEPAAAGGPAILTE